MATLRWVGRAALVAQVNTVTVGGVAANGQVYTVTIGPWTVTYTASGVDTNTTIAAALAAALQASTIPAFAEITWTVLALVITGTAATPGYPFTQTSSATGTGTLVTATATANGSPNAWGNAINWSTSALPANGDTVYLDGGPPIWWDLAQSAVSVTLLDDSASFTADVGLPETNSRGSSSYEEYRPQYLQLGATTANIGRGDGQGHSRFKWDMGTSTPAVNIGQSSSGADTGIPAILLKGGAAGTVVSLARGQVGGALFGGDSGTWTTLNAAYVTSPSSDAAFRGGPGLVLTTLNADGGSVTLDAGVTTLSIENGAAVTVQAGSITTLTVDKGTCVYKGTGTIGTLNGGNEGTLDCSQDPGGRTVTNSNLYAGFRLLDPNGTITWTNATSLVRCDVTDLGEFQVGKGRTVKVV